MSAPTQAAAEVIILQPESLGGEETDGDSTNKLGLEAGQTKKLGDDDRTRKLGPDGQDLTSKLAGGEGADVTARLSGRPAAKRFEIEIEADQGIAPLIRAAETVLRQGKRHVVLDLTRFPKLKADELRMLIEARQQFDQNRGSMIVTGLQRQVAAALKALELDTQLDVAQDTDAALDAIQRSVSRRQERLSRLGELSVEIHRMPLGRQRGDESFVDDYRKQGPEGLSRELVIFECDRRGVSKVAQKVRQLSDKQIDNFIVDLDQVESLEGGAVKELLRAQRHVAARNGYLAVVNAREAVAGLMKVMGLERELASFATEDAAVEHFKEQLLDQVDDRMGLTAPRGISQQTLKLSGPSETSEGGLRELESERPGEYVFSNNDDAEPARKNVLTVPKIAASPDRLQALGEAVGEVASPSHRYVIVDLSEVQRLDAAGIDMLDRAQRAAGDSYVVFSEASKDVIALAKLMGVSADLPLFAQEDAAVRHVAERSLADSDAGGVTLRLAEHESAEDEERGRTMSFGIPDFEDGDDADDGSDLEETDRLAAPSLDPKRVIHQTAAFQVPNFDDDDEVEDAAPLDDTDKFAVPSFTEDKTSRKTAEFSVPDFDDEDDESELKNSDEETDRLAIPPFAEEEDRPVHQTAEFSVPNFDDDDEDVTGNLDETSKLKPVSFGDPEERKIQKTAEFSVPDFDDGDDDGDFDETAKLKPMRNPTLSFGAPDFEDDDGGEGNFDDTTKLKPVTVPDAGQVHQTAEFQVPNFDDDDDGDDDGNFDETTKLRAPDLSAPPEAEAPAAGAIHKTAEFQVPNFDDDDDDDDEDNPRPLDDTDRLAVPSFDEDAEEEKPSHKTAEFSVPDFDDDDDEDTEGEVRAHETGRFDAPDFDDSEADTHQTARFGTPSFDDDDDGAASGAHQTARFGTPDFDDSEARPHETARFGTPSFDDDDDDDDDGPRAGRTTVMSAPDFDDDDDERSGSGRTTVMSAPDFDDDEDNDDRKGAGRTTVLNAPDFDDEEETERGLGKTAAAAVAAAAAGEMLDTARLRQDQVPTSLDLAELSTESSREVITEEGKPFRSAATEVMPGLTPDQVAAMEAEAAPSPARQTPAASGGGDLQVAKTEQMDGMTKEQALAHMRGEADAGRDLQEHETGKMDGMTKGEATLREAKTEAMDGMTKEQAAAEIAAAAGASSGPAPPPVTAPPIAPAGKSKAPLIIGAVVALALTAGIGLNWDKITGGGGSPSPTASGSAVASLSPSTAATVVVTPSVVETATPAVTASPSVTSSPVVTPSATETSPTVADTPAQAAAKAKLQAALDDLFGE